MKYLLVLAAILGTLADVSAVYNDIYGRKCDSTCDNKGPKGLYTYHFCYIGGTWDYCSPGKGITVNGFTCKSSHSCDRHDKDYYWCYTKNGSWDYCSPSA